MGSDNTLLGYNCSNVSQLLHDRLPRCGEDEEDEEGPSPGSRSQMTEAPVGGVVDGEAENGRPPVSESSSETQQPAGLVVILVGILGSLLALLVVAVVGLWVWSRRGRVDGAGAQLNEGGEASAMETLPSLGGTGVAAGVQTGLRHAVSGLSRIAGSTASECSTLTSAGKQSKKPNTNFLSL
jgi:hypothetical protein